MALRLVIRQDGIKTARGLRMRGIGAFSSAPKRKARRTERPCLRAIGLDHSIPAAYPVRLESSMPLHRPASALAQTLIQFPQGSAIAIPLEHTAGLLIRKPLEVRVLVRQRNDRIPNIGCEAVLRNHVNILTP